MAVNQDTCRGRGEGGGCANSKRTTAMHGVVAVDGPDIMRRELAREQPVEKG